MMERVGCRSRTDPRLAKTTELLKTQWANMNRLRQSSKANAAPFHRLRFMLLAAVFLFVFETSVRL